MNIIEKIQKAPVDLANAVTDHAMDRVRDLLAQVFMQLGPAGQQLIAQLETEIGAVIVQAGQAGERLEDHAIAGVGAQVAALAPYLETHEIVMRIGLEKKA